MKQTILFSLIFAVFTVTTSNAINSSYKISPSSVFEHIRIIADDSLEGRQVGEPGELKAALYIQKVFQEAGLTPKGSDGYFQYYDFIKNIEFGENNSLVLNGTELKLDEDFQPLKQSASISFNFNEIIDVDYGIKTGNDSGNYNDYAGKDVSGKAVLIKRYAPSSDDNPHIDFDRYSSLTDKISTAIDHDAKAVIFYTPENHDDTLISMGVTNVFQKDIPILFLRRQAIERLGLDIVSPAISSVSGEIELITVRDTAQNVIGYLDAGTDTTVIIGAHYDHLGYGGPTSLYTGPERLIHNGADDNGSGVATLLELARLYSQATEQLNYSILFLAISGEEAGLLGASNFARNMTIDSSKIRMMLNIDMVGRLQDQENGLAILGTGTCQEFKDFFDSLDYKDINLSLKESGTGPSDHTIFYNRGIPVLHFFTGAHSDYHKPTDDIDKIDSQGIVKVTRLIDSIVTYFNGYDQPLEFLKTKDESAGKRRAQYSVTLGIMPDYVAEVKGLKIDGVVEDRPGQKAGILPGDIILQLGNIVINDIYDYMSALGKFRKGDTTKAVIMRAEAQVELTVVFE